jgi:hypothetical protein
MYWNGMSCKVDEIQISFDEFALAHDMFSAHNLADYGFHPWCWHDMDKRWPISVQIEIEDL